MKSIWCALAMAGLSAIASARADDARNCDVPAYLVATESTLAKVADAVKAKRLDILVIGSGSSSLAGPDATALAYPARLQADLRERLAGVTVEVTTELRPKQTTEAVVEGLEKLVAERKPTLLIWQTGTVDAMRSVSPDDFRSSLDEGVALLKAAGSDVMLMNLQYSPRMETMISVAPYLDSMRVVAQQHDVPLFDRFAIMRQWNESGAIDLSGTSHGLALAKSVHNCIGRALSDVVINAAKIVPGESRIQR